MYYNEKTAARVINSLIDSIVDDARENLRHAWIDEAGRMCACDGFRAYRLNVPVAGVPDIEAERAINLNKIFPENVEGRTPLDLPKLADVKAMIEADKQAKKRGEEPSFLFTFGATESGELLPAVNLLYLAEILQMFPNSRAYAGRAVDPILFRDENGEALLLPVRAGNGIDASKRRPVPVLKKKDNAPALGLRAFAAIYAA